MKTVFIDQLNRKVEINFPPKRIISLVPSQTELLYDLGLDDEVVGQTIFCIHPYDKHQSKPRIGGTKKLNLDKIAELKPDLIIGNKEENDQSQIEALMKLYPVWMSDIKMLDDALNMIERVGELVNKKDDALKISIEIKNSFTQLTHHLSPKTPQSLYLIWREPYMAAGKNTFIDDMLKRCGFKNVVEESRYPEISVNTLQLLNPELILLSSEPYPFKQKHIDELQSSCPNSKIMLVDGELFSWYGSRLLKSVSYFKSLVSSLEF